MQHASSQPTGLSRTDQVVVMGITAIILLLFAVAAYIFFTHPESIPPQFRPNPRPFFDQLNVSVYS